MSRPKPARIIRVAGRFGLAIAIVFVLGVVGMQFAGIVAKNIAVANELSTSRAEVASLRERERRQQHTISRLQTASGSIPEIHERLRLVRPNEEIIFVRGGANDPQGSGDAGDLRP